MPMRCKQSEAGKGEKRRESLKQNTARAVQRFNEILQHGCCNSEKSFTEIDFIESEYKQHGVVFSGLSGFNCFAIKLSLKLIFQ